MGDLVFAGFGDSVAKLTPDAAYLKLTNDSDGSTATSYVGGRNQSITLKNPMTGPLTTTGTITATSVSTSGAVTSGSISTSGAVTAGSVSTSGAVNAGSMTASGAITAGSVSSGPIIANGSSLPTRWVATSFPQTPTLTTYYKIATLLDSGNGGNAARLSIKGTIGDWATLRTSIDAFIQTRGGFSTGGFVTGYIDDGTQVPSSVCEIETYLNSGVYSIYIRMTAGKYCWFDLTLNGDSTNNWGLVVFPCSTTSALTTTPAGVLQTPTLVNSCGATMALNAAGRVGIGTYRPVNAKLEVNGNIGVVMNQTGGGVSVFARNQATGESWSDFYLGNDSIASGGGIFLNASNRTGDGGGNCMTLRNNVGNLRLAASGSAALIQLSSSTGCVGIKNEAPTYPLDVTGQIRATVSTSQGIVLKQTTTAAPCEIFLDATVGGASQGAARGMSPSTSRNFFIWMNGSDRLNINEIGEVGIGQAPVSGQRLRVNGDASFQQVNASYVEAGTGLNMTGFDSSVAFGAGFFPYLYNWNTSQPTWKAKSIVNGINGFNHSALITSVGNPTGDRFVVYNSTGNAGGAYGYYNGGWGSTSDRRAKKNIDGIDEARSINFIKALQPRQFEFTEGIPGVQAGFVAQEVLEAAGDYAPLRSIVDNCDAGGDTLLGITPSKMLPPLIQTVQHLLKRIEALEARLGSQTSPP